MNALDKRRARGPAWDELVETEPGVYKRWSYKKYSAIRALNASGIEAMRDRGVAHLDEYLRGQERKSRAMSLGLLAHALVFEPEREYAMSVIEGCSARTKAGKRCKKMGVVLQGGEWLCGTHGDKEAGNDPGTEIVSQADYDAARWIRDALYSHPEASTHLRSPGPSELTVVADGGVPLKVRIDHDAERMGALNDLKTTGDIRTFAIERTAGRLGYHRKAALYLETSRLAGRERSEFFLIFAESAPPWTVEVALYTPEDLATARDQCAAEIERVKHAVETGDWWPQRSGYRYIRIPRHERASEGLT